MENVETAAIAMNDLITPSSVQTWLSYEDSIPSSLVMSAQDQSNIPDAHPVDNDYISRPGQKDIVPVQRDGAPVEDPIDPATANSDAQLQRDEKDAIDKSNIIEEKTRGNTKPAGTYQAPGDEESLPVNDGRSAIAQ
ncbi:histone chaperone CHZ domain-containing protein [Rutstroemia sp. NJR-2017a WRK4]|nr:histone chaperone CHZ domain-containing protein [Rutstroemia sp. NJR-2017a WRK4]